MSSRAVAGMTARSAMGEHHGLRSETGYVRKTNEDRMGFRRTIDGEVYVVCDGMGGTKGGAKAAQLAVQALIERLNDPMGASDLRKRMQTAFAEANSTVFRHRRPDDPETRDMGSTAVAVLLRGTRLLIGHVGDSRVYRWSKARGLWPLTRDHTRAQRLVDAEVISPIEAAAHPEASILDRAMGHQPQVEAEISDWVSLERGESVLLCSDGLSGYASDSEINAVMSSENDPQRQADKLTELALKKGGEDNVTVQVVQVNGMNSSILARFFRSPLAMLLTVTLVYLSMASWFHSEFAALHASNQDLQKKIDALTKSASAPIGEEMLNQQVNALNTRIAKLEQANSQSPQAAGSNPAAPRIDQMKKKTERRSPATITDGEVPPQEHRQEPSNGSNAPAESQPSTGSATVMLGKSGTGAAPATVNKAGTAPAKQVASPSSTEQYE